MEEKRLRALVWSAFATAIAAFAVSLASVLVIDEKGDQETTSA